MVLQPAVAAYTLNPAAQEFTMTKKGVDIDATMEVEGPASSRREQCVLLQLRC